MLKNGKQDNQRRQQLKNIVKQKSHQKTGDTENPKE